MAAALLAGALIYINSDNCGVIFSDARQGLT